MCMFSRRLQILLDPDRAERLEAEATRRGVSVAAIVREGLDAVLPGHDRRDKAQLLAELLDGPELPVPEDPAELRAELDTAHAPQSS